MKLATFEVFGAFYAPFWGHFLTFHGHSGDIEVEAEIEVAYIPQIEVSGRAGLRQRQVKISTAE